MRWASAGQAADRQVGLAASSLCHGGGGGQSFEALWQIFLCDFLQDSHLSRPPSSRLLQLLIGCLCVGRAMCVIGGVCV